MSDTHKIVAGVLSIVLGTIILTSGQMLGLGIIVIGIFVLAKD